MSLIPFFISLNNLFGVQTVLNRGYKKPFLGIIFVSLICFLCLSFILVPLLQAEGTSISIAATELLVLLLMAAYIKRKSYFQRIEIRLLNSGAGFAGITTARLIADVLNKKVLVVDLRNHIAGNAYDYTEENGILVHKYGPHIFHTNDEKFLIFSQFTCWYKYEHKVVSRYEGSYYPIPVNMVTLNKLYSLNLTNAEETKKYLDSVTSGIGNPKTRRM